MVLGRESITPEPERNVDRVMIDQQPDLADGEKNLLLIAKIIMIPSAERSIKKCFLNFFTLLNRDHKRDQCLTIEWLTFGKDV